MTFLKYIRNWFKRNWVGRLLKWASVSVVLCMTIIFLVVRFSYSKYIYSSIDSLPETKVGLLLGTSKFIKGNQLNPYYYNRILAAVELIKKGKIKYIIVSGDNRVVHYNEPVQMRDDLIKLGVDPKIIYLDYAGFRTLDSIIRAKEVFGQDTFVIISQAFHNQRAMFIARQKNIKALAYNAKDIEFPRSLKVQFRELFARVKLMIDLYLINKQPKFLGKKVIIGS